MYNAAHRSGCQLTHSCKVLTYILHITNLENPIGYGRNFADLVFEIEKIVCVDESATKGMKKACRHQVCKRDVEVVKEVDIWKDGLFARFDEETNDYSSSREISLL